MAIQAINQGICIAIERIALLIMIVIGTIYFFVYDFTAWLFFGYSRDDRLYALGIRLTRDCQVLASSSDDKSNDPEKEPNDSDDDEETSYEIEEEIQNTQRLRLLIIEADKLDKKLPESEKHNNSYLKALREDPLVKEYLQGDDLKPKDLWDLDEVLEDAESRSWAELEEARLMAEAEAIIKEKEKAKEEALKAKQKAEAEAEEKALKFKGKGRASEAEIKAQIEAEEKANPNWGRGKRKADDYEEDEYEYIGKPGDRDYDGKDRPDGPSNSRFNELNNTWNNKEDYNNLSDYKLEKSLLDHIIDILKSFF